MDLFIPGESLFRYGFLYLQKLRLRFSTCDDYRGGRGVGERRPHDAFHGIGAVRQSVRLSSLIKPGRFSATSQGNVWTSPREICGFPAGEQFDAIEFSIFGATRDNAAALAKMRDVGRAVPVQFVFIRFYPEVSPDAGSCHIKSCAEYSATVILDFLTDRSGLQANCALATL
ncbi:hypothetical protein J6590_023587 [Homalodisca vitripennis]|nr:hypothetical protein J6590_023587 [Homalodisca vitripennis]